MMDEDYSQEEKEFWEDNEEAKSGEVEDAG